MVKSDTAWFKSTAIINILNCHHIKIYYILLCSDKTYRWPLGVHRHMQSCDGKAHQHVNSTNNCQVRPCSKNIRTQTGPITAYWGQATYIIVSGISTTPVPATFEPLFITYKLINHIGDWYSLIWQVDVVTLLNSQSN